MLRKLSEAKLEELLEAGVEEFALHGLNGASMRTIADRAGISVGVLYKYYAHKEAFFQACIRRSLEALNAVLAEVMSQEAELKEYARRIIQSLFRFSREHAGYVRLYCTIAATGGAGALRLAGEIESITAQLYTRFVSAGRNAGVLRRDLDPDMFAFFFDNLLVMVQFTGCCDYYRERFRLYCGASLEEQEERLERELLKFLESAFTFEEADIRKSS